MSEEQFEKFQETIIKQIAGYTAAHSNLMMELKGEMIELKGEMRTHHEDLTFIKNRLDKLNGSVSDTKDRVLILETDLKPIKSIVNRVIWTIVASFMAAIGYVIYKK